MTTTQNAEAATEHRPLPHSPLFRAGTWTTFPFDPCAKTTDWDDALGQLGFSQWTATDGMTDSADLLPLSLRIWMRSEHPRYVVEVDTIDSFDHVLAHDLPDVMELLARWAPAIQAFAVAGLIGDANQISNGRGAQKTLLGLARAALGQPA
ncbi:hypothetical protein AB0C77_12725 [Streptomyces sp. NPDC048629]|uniref:hypothetical protein n=1 Tax=Streptomyces sp. NPDC048629 TaxID=3154824 RepID=UPI00342E5674